MNREIHGIPANRAMESRESVILDSINEGVFMVDLDWHITAFNSAAEKFTGVSRQEAVGCPPSLFGHSG